MKYAIIFVTLALALTAQTGKAGNSVENGGDSVALDFAGIVKNVVNRVSISRPVYAEGFFIDEMRLKEKMLKLQVKALDGPLNLRGKRVVAINYPIKNVIEVDRQEWPRLDRDAKYQLAIHELIGLTFPEISDESYSYSQDIWQTIESTENDIKVFTRISAIPKNGNPVVLGESQVRISSTAKSEPEDLQGFVMEFSLADSYLDIVLRSPKGDVVLSTKQFVGHDIDFETTVSYPVTIDGVLYDKIQLECQDPLIKTP